jgi:hypothetical protein
VIGLEEQGTVSHLQDILSPFCLCRRPPSRYLTGDAADAPRLREVGSRVPYVFSLKKCGVFEYGARVYPERVGLTRRENPGVQGLQVTGHSLSPIRHCKVHASDLVKRIKRRIRQLKHTALKVGLSLPTSRKVNLA